MTEEKKEPEQDKKLAGIFFDLEKMENVLDQIMKDLVPKEELEAGKPVTLNFSMKINPDGKVEISKSNCPLRSNQPADYREPLVEILEQSETTMIIAEMPGIEEKDIQISSWENILEIKAMGEKRFYKKIALKETIRRMPLQKFKNGILELRLEK